MVTLMAMYMELTMECKKASLMGCLMEHNSYMYVDRILSPFYYLYFYLSFHTVIQVSLQPICMISLNLNRIQKLDHLHMKLLDLAKAM